MSLSLSSRDLSRLRESASTLLSPLGYGDTGEWMAAAMQSLARLLSGNSGAVILPEGATAHLFTEGMDHEAFVRFQARVLSTEPGDTYTEEFTGAMRPVQESGAQVVTSEDLVRLTGIPLVEMPQYHEALEPSGIRYTINIAVPQESGEALLGVGRGPRGRGPFAERERALLWLLAPAFEAGVQAWRQISSRRDALGAMVDRLHDGACILDGRGRVLHTNASLDDLEGGDPEFDRVISALAKVARDFLARPNRKAGPASAAAGFGSRLVETARDRYVLTPTMLPEGMVGLEPVVLVVVWSGRPTLPSEGELRDRFGLTRREAEVAILLVRGLSNRRIAERLFLSPFTVRHHAQRVLEKVGVHSRKVLLLRFLGRPEVL